MLCPFCGGGESRVVDSRLSGSATRRRRECLACSKRFTTYERLEMPPLLVVKKDGSRERFSKEKVREGVLRACEKRPVSSGQIEELVEKVARAVLEKGPEVSSRRIGELVMRRLRKLDKVAYIRFASVYRNFEDVDSFEEEVKKLR
ncbi:transcriptional repressor NrdR [Candidatus Woesearchaeota archaeon]|nr:MAG: transcriptional repressor NrdR [Candidatus Woesearchaeota archaeon]